jgi:hypothetical protein
LIQKTVNESIGWEVVSPYRYERIIANPDAVVRAYESRLDLKGKAYPVLTVEKKNWAHDDYGQEFERLDIEVYVMNSDYNLIFPIYEGLVDRDDLLKLISAISDTSDQSKEFFDAISGEDEESE